MNNVRYEINEAQYNAICNHLESSFKDKKEALMLFIKYSDFSDSDYLEIKRKLYELRTLVLDSKNLSALVPVFSVGEDEEI